MDVDPHLTLLRDRFVNRPALYYVQWADAPGRHGYRRVDASVTNEVILQHLTFQITLSLPAIDSNAMCKWCCWDNDNDNGNLQRIENALRELNLNPMRESVRPGREGHLWLFFDRKVPAIHLQRFDKFIRDNILDLVIEDELEFFPKQVVPCDANGVRLPLGVNLKIEAGLAEGWFAGATKYLEEQLTWFAEQQLDSASRLMAVTSTLLETDTRAPKQKKRLKESASLQSLEDLNPVEHGSYFSCDCPKCSKHTAYVYKDGIILRCNRRNKCGFTTTLSSRFEC